MDNYSKFKELYGDTAFLPIIPMRGIVAFPKAVIHLEIGRKKTASGLNFALKGEQFVFLTLQTDFTAEEITPDSVCKVGTLAKIKQFLKVHGDTPRATFEVICRAEIVGEIRDIGYEAADIRLIPEETLSEEDSEMAAALIRKTKKVFEEMTGAMEKIYPEAAIKVMLSKECGELADCIAQGMPFGFEDKQILLEKTDPEDRAIALITVMNNETDMAILEKKIDEKVGKRMNKNQHDFVIREQIRALQEELGPDAEGGMPYDDDEDNEYYDKIDALALPAEVREKLLKEVSRLMKMPATSQEAAVARSYLDECLDLPWGIFTKEALSVERAEKILNADHYGLTKVKERILEVLSVRKLTAENPPADGEKNAQILCLVGPPGTGKTSIAMSVAKALNRKFARVSLGGVHDEAEIRGHRRTYIGSMPGRILNAVKEAKSCNPVILLDEIDKLGADYKGDPSSALLEVLDPEQNKTFKDNFIDMPFDLSDVFFITTANVIENIPRPLLDRMDVIELSSYTAEEKFQIAKRHLVAKELKKHGFTPKMLRFSEKSLREIIDRYTKEAGVRNLEREIAAVCRKAAKEWLEQEEKTTITVREKDVERYLGPRKFIPEQLNAKPQIGVVTGLAYTAVGGETMPIEVNVMEGAGKVELTGLLGDVMKESAHAAVSFIRANADKYGISPDFYKTKDIHIHVPEGAVPKDGPSAGVTISTALISQLSMKPVRNDIAMTGEITLRGKVLPIGGLKEKTMAAYKAGIREVLIPKDNEPDLYEVDPVVKEHILFKPVSTIDEVVQEAIIQ